MGPAKYILTSSLSLSLSGFGSVLCQKNNRRIEYFSLLICGECEPCQQYHMRQPQSKSTAMKTRADVCLGDVCQQCMGNAVRRARDRRRPPTRILHIIFALEHVYANAFIAVNTTEHGMRDFGAASSRWATFSATNIFIVWTCLTRVCSI